jgi:hypothetical protein
LSASPGLATKTQRHALQLADFVAPGDTPHDRGIASTADSCLPDTAQEMSPRAADLSFAPGCDPAPTRPYKSSVDDGSLRPIFRLVQVDTVCPNRRQGAIAAGNSVTSSTCIDKLHSPGLDFTTTNQHVHCRAVPRVGQIRESRCRLSLQ